MTDRYRKRDFTPRPEKIETPAERGQALKNFLDVNELSVASFALAANISRPTLYEYLRGDQNLASLPKGRAEALVTAMGISDVDAWEVLGIPEDRQEVFRTLRPPPLGHGAAIERPSHITRHLGEPMHGIAPAPSGATAIIDPDGIGLPVQVIELPDGRLHSVGLDLLDNLKPSAGKHLGGLVSVNYDGSV